MQGTAAFMFTAHFFPIQYVFMRQGILMSQCNAMQGFGNIISQSGDGGVVHHTSFEPIYGILSDDGGFFFVRTFIAETPFFHPFHIP